MQHKYVNLCLRSRGRFFSFSSGHGWSADDTYATPNRILRSIKNVHRKKMGQAKHVDCARVIHAARALPLALGSDVIYVNQLACDANMIHTNIRIDAVLLLFLVHFDAFRYWQPFRSNHNWLGECASWTTSLIRFLHKQPEIAHIEF